MSWHSGLIVSVSGIRGIVGEGLRADTALAFASAFAEHAGGGRIVLSRDGRRGGAMLRHAVAAGLLAAGCDIEDIGIASTPTCGLAVQRLSARGGIQITASHNPAGWNGLKLFGGDGRVLSAAQGKAVQAIFERRTFSGAPEDKLGTCHEAGHAADWHCQRVLELVDAESVRARAPRIFLDANGGAGGPLGLLLLKSLGCTTFPQGCNADGIFLHDPEPVAANLRATCPLVARHGADVGFVLDPDADRLALIDEQGHYIGEELTLALAVMFRLSQLPHGQGSVVINMSTSRVIEDIAQRHGSACWRAAVGEANVADKMLETGAVIGGEGNGGVIDPRVGLVRDPFIGMGLILNLLAESGKKLSELVAQLPVYSIVKQKYALDPARLAELLARLQAHWPEAKANRLDGLRLDWTDRWIHIRPSNTEPIIRVIAEARTASEAENQCARLAELCNL